MTTPAQTFRLQTQLSTWSGTKKIAGWLAIVALALCAGSAVLIFAGKERGVVALASPLLMVVVCLLLRTQAKKKITEIEAALSS